MKQKYVGPESYTTSTLAALEHIDWKDKTREAGKFLFDPSESNRVLWFREYATDERIRDWLREDDIPHSEIIPRF